MLDNLEEWGADELFRIRSNAQTGANAQRSEFPDTLYLGTLLA